MTYRVLTELKVKTAQGEAILPPGQLIRLDPAKAKPLIESFKIRLTESEISFGNGEVPFWTNPYPQGTPEARRQSREDALTALLLDSRNQIIEACKGRHYHADEKTQQMKLNIDRIWNEVIAGSAKLEDFRTACGNWISSSAEAIHE